MKAVVLEVKDGYATLLAADGQFIKIKDCDCRAGMELTLEETRPKGNRRKTNVSYFRRTCAIALSAAAAFLLVIGIKDFHTPYSIISIDVNPSIEISANRYDLVLGIEAVNDDAKELVSELTAEGLQYKSIDTAVEAALIQISEGGYQAENGTTYVMMSANSENTGHSEELADQLTTIGEEHPDISATAIAADDELLERAKDAGTTAGKLYLVDCLKDAEDSPDFNENEWLKKPVKDIMQEIDRSEMAPKQEVLLDGGSARNKEEAASSPMDSSAEPSNAPQNKPENTPAESRGDGKDPAPNSVPDTASGDSAAGENPMVDPERSNPGDNPGEKSESGESIPPSGGNSQTEVQKPHSFGNAFSAADTPDRASNAMESPQ